MIYRRLRYFYGKEKSMERKIDLKAGVLILMIFAAAFSRLLPHPHNFTPIGAISLFGAAYFSRKYLAFVVPFLAMWFSDLLINNVVYAQMYPEYYSGFSWFGNPAVYLSFALIVLLGFVLLQKVTPLRLLGGSLSASLLFFLVTNAQVWLVSPTYPNTGAGLMAAYAAGIPFFWNTLLGDLFFTGVLFGAFAFFQHRFPVLRRQEA